MKCDPSSSRSILGIAGVSIIFPTVLAQLGVLEQVDSGNPLIAKKEIRVEEIRVLESSSHLRENFYRVYIPESYAIKPEEDRFVLDWRDFPSYRTRRV